jgi:hypothetical protein
MALMGSTKQLNDWVGNQGALVYRVECVKNGGVAFGVHTVA